MDESEYDLYGDLGEFDLSEQLKEKVTVISDLEKKLRLTEETIATLEQEKKILCGEKATLERNMTSLLKTAKAEISRKNNQIDELRRQNSNMCFRRVGQRAQHPVETHSKETMTDPSILSSQRTHINHLVSVKSDVVNEKKNSHIIAADQQAKKTNPFSSRTTTSRSSNNDRNGIVVSLPTDDGRQKSRSRSTRYDDVPARDDDKRHLRAERSSKRKRSRERLPEPPKERPSDYSRDRKRARPDEKRLSRRNKRDDDSHTDHLRKSKSNGNERNKRTRGDRKGSEEVTHKKSKRCDIKLEPIEIKKEKSPIRNSNEKPAIAMSASNELKREASPVREEKAVASEILHKFKPHETFPRNCHTEKEEGEVVDSEEFNSSTDNMGDASADGYHEVKNDNTASQQALQHETKIIAVTSSASNSIDATSDCKPQHNIGHEQQSLGAALNGIESTETVMAEDDMELEIFQMTPTDNQNAISTELLSVEKNDFVQVTRVQESVETRDIQENGPIIEMEENIDSQSTANKDSVELSKHENGDAECQEENDTETHVVAADPDRDSPNTSMSKSVKKVSTKMADYQIVDEDNREIVIYMTRKKAKKPKKEKHKNKEKTARTSL